MIEFLQVRLASRSSPSLHIHLIDKRSLMGCDLLAADEMGIAVKDSEGELRLIPWSAIYTVTLED